MKKNKRRWCGEDKQYTAGGILFYDDNGVWTVGESINNEIIYTDPGGKYECEDGCIYGCISRELAQETYYTCEITRGQIRKMAQHHPIIDVCGNNKFGIKAPVYCCLLIPVKTAKTIDVFLDPEKFLKSREEILKHNPNPPKWCFSSVCLKYLPFESIEKHQYKISYRLYQILKKSELCFKRSRKFDRKISYGSSGDESDMSIFQKGKDEVTE